MSELTSKNWVDSATKLIDFDQINAWLEQYKTTQNENKQLRIQNIITITCLPLVRRVAKTLARRSTDPVEDLIQVGSLGLIKAVRSYNPGISQNFRSYATYLITGEIRHYLRDKATMIRAPRSIQELAFRVQKLSMEMIEELGDKPTNDDIAEKISVKTDRVQEAMFVERRRNIISLDQLTVEDEFMNWTDRIADYSYEYEQNLCEAKITLADSIELLEEPYKRIIEMSYFEDYTQTEIANKMGLSQMQISRKHRRALKKLYAIIQAKNQEFSDAYVDEDDTDEEDNVTEDKDSTIQQVEK